MEQLRRIAIYRAEQRQLFNDTLTATSGYINSPASVAAMNWLGELFHKYHYTHVEDLSADFPENFAMSLSLPSAYFQSQKGIVISA